MEENNIMLVNVPYLGRAVYLCYQDIGLLRIQQWKTPIRVEDKFPILDIKDAEIDVMYTFKMWWVLMRDYDVIAVYPERSGAIDALNRIVEAYSKGERVLQL